LIEQLLEEGAKGGCIRISGWTRNRKWNRPNEVTPQQGRQIGDMIWMQMTDGDQCEVIEARARLCKTKERTASGIDENPTPPINPNQVAGRR
jgi:hypothetical protein